MYNPAEKVGSAVADPKGAVESLGSDIGAADPLGFKGKKKADERQAEKEKEALEEKAKEDEAAVGRISEEQIKAAGEVADSIKGTIESLGDLSKQAGTATETLQSSLGALGTEAKESSAKRTKETEAALGDLKKLTEETDPTKLAEKLAKEQKEITEQKVKLAEQTLKQSEQLSKWYEGIATSYEDIGKRYKDAVTGLTDAEKTSMRGGAQQDFAAMSATGAQGMAASMKAFGPMSGAQMSMLAAESQKSATGAYSMALNRMEAVDQQRRQMQFAMAQSAMADERANRALGASIMGQEIGFASAARESMGASMQEGFMSRAAMQSQALENKFQHGLSTTQTTLSGIQQMAGYDQFSIGTRMSAAEAGFQGDMARLGFQQSGVLASGDLSRESIMTQLGAQTYKDEAGIAMRAGNFEQQMALEDRRRMRAGERARTQGAMIGAITGIVGGIAGGYASDGNPQAMAKGAEAGQGIGQGLGAGFGG